MNESTDSSTASETRQRAASLKQRLKQDGRQKIESGKRAAADQIAEIADAIDVAGSQLDQSQPTLASYASRLADGVSGLATRLREDSIEDMYRDVRQVATRHPGMFLLGSAALGLVLARFMKVSASDASSDMTSDSAEYQRTYSASASGGGVDVEGTIEDRADSTQDIVEREDLRWQGGPNAARPDPYGSPNTGG